MQTRFSFTCHSEFWRFSDSRSGLSLASDSTTHPEPVKSQAWKIGAGSNLPPDTASPVQKQRPSLEEEIFRLKLEWIMAKTDEEKQRVSLEIRERMGVA